MNNEQLEANTGKTPSRDRKREPVREDVHYHERYNRDDSLGTGRDHESDKRPVQIIDDPIRNALIPEPKDEKSDLIKYGELLTNKDNKRYLLERLTELKGQEIKIFSIYLTYAEKYDIRCIKDILYMQMSLNFSKGRKRVSELVKLFQSAEHNDERETKEGLIGLADRFRRK